MKCLAESTVELRIAIVPNRTPGVAHLPVLSSIDRAEVTAKLLTSGWLFPNRYLHKRCSNSNRECTAAPAHLANKGEV